MAKQGSDSITTGAILALIIVAVSMGGCTKQEEDVITVSAAASLRAVFDDLARNFELTHPNVRVELNYASSGILRTQIEQGAPVGVFASASVGHMDVLQSKNMVLAGTRKDFAGNSLVIIVPQNSDDNITLHTLMDTDRIALGDPAHVPAGRYAKETLETSGLWTAIQERAIYAANVKQVLDYVSRGEVAAGFVYETDIVGSVRTSQTVHERLHSPIIYTIAVLGDAENPELANTFVEFVVASDRTIAGYGFTPIKGELK